MGTTAAGQRVELFDVAITNAYILLKLSGSCPFKSFRLHLAKDLIGDYYSRRRRDRGGTVTIPALSHQAGE